MQRESTMTPKRFLILASLTAGLTLPTASDADHEHLFRLLDGRFDRNLVFHDWNDDDDNGRDWRGSRFSRDDDDDDSRRKVSRGKFWRDNHRSHNDDDD